MCVWGSKFFKNSCDQFFQVLLYILIFLNFVVVLSLHCHINKPFLCKSQLRLIHISDSLCSIFKRAFIKIQVNILDNVHTSKINTLLPRECHWESKIITFHWNYIPSEFSPALLEALTITRECRWRQTNTTTMVAQNIVLAILCQEGNSSQITID